VSKQLHQVDGLGTVGYVSPVDRRGFEIDPKAWTGMNSVRMDSGGVEPAWGYKRQALDLPADAHSMDYVSNRDQSENFYIVGCDAAILAIYNDTGVLTSKEITRTDPLDDQVIVPYTGSYAGGDTWVTALKDGHLVLTNGKDAPQMVLRNNFAGLEAEEMPGFTTVPSIPGLQPYTTCKTIIAFKSFLVAGNIGFLNADNQPNMIAWSDAADNGSLPSGWDYSDENTISGNSTMPSDFGAVIALEEQRGDLMVYCERGCYRMQYTGDSFIFRIAEAFDTVGALNPRATCSNRGLNIVVSRTDIMLSDGQAPQSIADGLVRKELFGALSQTNDHMVQVVEYPAKSEVLVICPGKQDSLWMGTVLAWSWITNTWSKRNGLLMRCLANVPQLVSTVDPLQWHAQQTYDEIYRWGHDITDGTTLPPAAEQINPVTDVIDSTPDEQDPDQYDILAADVTYGTILADEGVLYMFGIATYAKADFPEDQEEGAETNIYQFDWFQYSYGLSPTANRTPYIERRGINVSNDETVQMVTAVYPRMEGAGPIEIRVGAVDYIGGAVGDIRWDPAVVFNPETDYRITCRVAGRRHAIRFDAVSKVDQNGEPNYAYSNFRLAGYDLEFSHVGRR